VTPSYYQPSGRVSILGLLAALIVGAAVAGIGGFVYAVVLVYNPSAYLGLVLPVLYGAGVAAATSFAGKKLKVRNAWVLMGLSVVLTMGGYLLSWIPWEYFTLSHLGNDVDWLAVIYPPSFIEILGLIYENGAWTIGTSGSGGAVSGVMLGIVWLLEAASVFGASAVTAFTVGSSGVFCETCEEWCTRIGDLFHHAPEAQSQITDALATRRDLSVLTSAPPATGTPTWLETELSHCRCGATNTILVQHCERKVDRRGNASVHKTPIVKHLLVAREEADWVRRAAGRT
jgi:hypothetical protein